MSNRPNMEPVNARQNLRRHGISALQATVFQIVEHCTGYRKTELQQVVVLRARALGVRN